MTEETTAPAAEEQEPGEGGAETPEGDVTPESQPDKDYKKMFEDQRIRAQKAEDREKKLREILEDKDEVTENKPESQDPLDTVADALDVIRELKGDELAELRREAKELGVSQAAFIKSPAGKAYLKEIRRLKEVAATTPPPSTKAKTEKEEVPRKFKTYEEYQQEKKRATGGSE
jgi:hypothetical protein